MHNTYLLTEEQQKLQRWAYELAQAEFQASAERWEREGIFPWEHVATLAEQGLLGFTLPRAFGGLERSRLEAVLVLEQLARVCLTTAEIAHICMNGPSYAISRLGSQALQARYLPEVVAGKRLIGIAITEDEAGSSLGEISTRAHVRATSVVIDGRKCFTTIGDVGGTFEVVVRFGGEGTRGLGAVLVDADTPGFAVERVYEKIGGNGIHEAALRFEHCEVPREQVLIEGDPATSNGFKLVMRAYNALRLGIAANSLGVAQAALDQLVPYLLQRRQFGAPLAAAQGLRWRVARLALALEQARLLTYRAALLSDDYGFPPAYETALAKLAATEVALQAADEAIQVLGWRGITKDYAAERRYREIRGWTIAGGTSEMLLESLAKQVLRHYEQSSGHALQAE
uniref:Acyl-CoA dehydrogenase n=1 Tax=Thermogemmatispora argillosa TaxID=2045280 RepID=A0A455T123_9CHLR|nr:acyl-CoA dehydrogenase [Thermogemmatispora argillosa]